MNRRQKFSVVVGIAAVTVGVAASPAQARPLDQGHDREATSEVVEGFCGDLTMRIDDVFDVNFVLNRHGDAYAYDHQTVHDTTTFTNLDTQKSVTEVSNFVQKDLKVTDNGDGTLTILTLSSGSTKLFVPGHNIVLKDPGQTRGEVLIDDAGTPTDPFDDEFIAFLGVVKGSTGRNDLQGRDFCDDMHQFTA